MFSRPLKYGLQHGSVLAPFLLFNVYTVLLIYLDLCFKIFLYLQHCSVTLA